MRRPSSDQAGLSARVPDAALSVSRRIDAVQVVSGAQKAGTVARSANALLGPSWVKTTSPVVGPGELACRHARVFARHRTITALEHARALKVGRGVCTQTPVELRPLERYDQLIA
jgi:hypothetical protein